MTVDVAVVGAGIVGVCCALWAQRLGKQVLLIDANKPGRGASYGNAGTLATYACVPVNDPSLFRSLPHMLRSPDSPLSINWRYAIKNWPWMLSFLRNCTAKRVDEISDHLGALLKFSDAGIDPLIDEVGAWDLVTANDCLYVYSSKALFHAAQDGITRRRRNGVNLDILDGRVVLDLERALAIPVYKGLLFEGARHIRDPGALVSRMHVTFMRNGGLMATSNVDRVVPRNDGATVYLTDGITWQTRKVVIAAGAHSTTIGGTGVESLPLDTERGYNVTFRRYADIISRPIGWADAGFYATPMNMGLRIAGTVEIAGRDLPKSNHRVEYLKERAWDMFGDLGPPDTDWMGLRPTLPDALPVIGPSPISDNVLLAFGHQHIGLTLAGITGNIIADLLDGRQPCVDIAPYSAARFD